MISMAQTVNPTLSNSTLYMAFELGSTKWHLYSSTLQDNRVRGKTLTAGDYDGLRQELARARRKFNLPEDAPVVSCYEAGFSGFELDRYLREKLGVDNLVVDSASIEVNRRARQAKTDKLDGKKLLVMLLRYGRGETGVWSVVRVPDRQSEDARRLSRERDRLKKEHGGHACRIRSLLRIQGIILNTRQVRVTAEELEDMVTPSGEALGENLKAELRRELDRLRLVRKHRAEVERRQRAELRESTSAAIDQVRTLTNLRGVGLTSAWVLAMEFFSWREFKNRRQVGALAGMVSSPYVSDQMVRDQGISKAGNRRIRTLIIELSWLWIRHQPGSDLTRWFHARFGEGKRVRRIGIVALGRKLLVAFWRYLEHGVVPAGATFKNAAPPPTSSPTANSVMEI